MGNLYRENVVVPSASTSHELQRVLDWFETRLLEVRSHGPPLDTGGIPPQGHALVSVSSKGVQVSTSLVDQWNIKWINGLMPCLLQRGCCSGLL